MPVVGLTVPLLGSTAGNNRSNTAVRAVLEQPCSTGGRTGTVRPKHLPAGRTGLSDQFLGPVGQDQPGPVGQICPTSWLSLRSDSARPTTGRTRLFKHRSNCRVRPVNAGSGDSLVKMGNLFIGDSHISLINQTGIPGRGAHPSGFLRESARRGRRCEARAHRRAPGGGAINPASPWAQF
ncbi:hypothetical protein PCASD_05446 [Puccinia coronata f. sp. avenae]|uniref:Uncharacterized protein n=1 Tax=Puccinia coronata f. sp. avenae TaxID=200324 RepID=A0A2N5V8N0_9BASI|nr:hypothetical protein PCASD_05446 [Puccinia coronata f. sp. avenae]